MPSSSVDRFVDACEENDIDTVSQLIGGGVDINGKKSRGNTGLMMAMNRNNIAIVRMLLASESVNLAWQWEDSSSLGMSWGLSGVC